MECFMYNFMYLLINIQLYPLFMFYIFYNAEPDLEQFLSVVHVVVSHET